ncbi:uncharacterized protein BO66DRAFT_393127 [Aspergillus aculeatinus CBS 121060]|uniref:Uncharacterized protein n=1 Tax=Aspergillus aculeatinus CBS 121060 TaxID=1448322 RepID=A0ACD1H3V1_9EURO|nr:hypothetical protein BO66DRAFT_393127 [Aspergillus aculeatinus CBS 121060]RAH68291.1 hypothetical protein BO66DRAFT_393127 [Aspergillus aculeatinus CBS 121060]
MSVPDCAPSDAPLDIAAIGAADRVFLQLWYYHHTELHYSWVVQKETPWLRALGGPQQGLACFLEAVTQSLTAASLMEQCPIDESSAYGKMVNERLRGGLELVSYHWGHYAPTLARLYRERRGRARRFLDPDLWLASYGENWVSQAFHIMAIFDQAFAALGDSQFEPIIRACIQKYVGTAAVARMGTDNTQQPRHPTPFEHGHDCQICCRPLGDKLETIFWCKRYCGFAAHVGCIREWCRGRGLGHPQEAPHRNTCLHCRQPWLSPWGECFAVPLCDCRLDWSIDDTQEAPRQMSKGLPERPCPPLEWHSLY